MCALTCALLVLAVRRAAGFVSARREIGVVAARLEIEVFRGSEDVRFGHV